MIDKFMSKGRKLKIIFMVILALPSIATPNPAKINPIVLKSESDLEAGVIQGELGKKIDAYLTRITPLGFSGALLVAKDRNVILNKGYGMAIRSENIPNTSETVFSIGSITKQFTAAGIMKLEMQGKLSTNDSISRYFEDVPEEKKAITLHHLLTHTSGLIDFTGFDYQEVQREETVKKILDALLQFKPDERFSYSNAGYSLLAAIIEKVSGKTYEQFLHEYLFKPAGMSFTGYRIPEWDKRVVAHWYVGEKDNGIPLEKPYPFWNLLGNGGILSTTEDMYKWHLALLDDNILSAEAKKKIFTPYLNDYGYGWDVLQTERGILIQHDGGSMLGNSAEMRRYLNAGIVTILFCNQSFGKRSLMDAVRDKIETLVFGGEVTLPPPVKTVDQNKLQKYQGSYGLPEGGRLRVEVSGEKLLIEGDGQEAINALFLVEEAKREMYIELNQLSQQVFEAVLENNFEPLERVLHEKERRSRLVRQLIQERLDLWKPKMGEIQKVIARATLPVHFRGQEAAQTHLELKGERGSLFFFLYWQDKKNVGIGPALFLPDLSIPFLFLKDDEFAGYHIEMARNFRVRFSTDEQGRITSLSVYKEKENAVALKENK